ncbi:MAG: S8 family serine peptidase [Proteobacteria bacterium]|nr:S8 family serine peptidase [Pseudomonadota bacterium]
MKKYFLILQLNWLLIGAVMLIILTGCGGGGGGAAVRLTPEITPPINFISDLPDEFLTSTFDFANVNTVSLNSTTYQNEAQWGIKNSKANLAHWTYSGEGVDEALGSSGYIRGHGVTVAIVDHGVDLDHEDLVDNIVVAPGFMFASYNSLDHGTHVAGIVGAMLNNKGVVGVAPEAKLLPINYLDGGINLEDSYAYAAANHAFVANNSWSFSQTFVKISVAADEWQGNNGALGADFYWMTMPYRYYFHGSGSELDFISIINGSEQPILDPLEKAVLDDEMLLIFSTGNTGWNGSTGKVSYCSDATFSALANKKDCIRNVVIELDNTDINDLTLYGGYATAQLTFAMGGSQVFDDQGENLVDFLNDLPVSNPSLTIGWLNVAAIDSNNNLASFSNGCGATKHVCLVAPGVDVTSTILDDQTGSRSGTSMAAPHVTGAAALLKGAFPNLTAGDVANIILQSADGMGDCAGEISKAVSCTDDAYGHGALNVSAAFTPVSFIQIANNVGGNFRIENSHINLSPAFAGGSWREETLRIGGLDHYGRAFYTRMDLADGIWVTKPVPTDEDGLDNGIHAAYAAPTAQQQKHIGFSAEEQLLAYDWQASASSTQALNYAMQFRAGYASRSALWQGKKSDITWRYRVGSRDWQPTATKEYWQAAFDNGAVHQIQWQQNTPTNSNTPQFGALYGTGDGVVQAGARLAWQQADWQLQLESGVLHEEQAMLGANFSGGFVVENTRNIYQRIAGSYQIEKVQLFADYVYNNSQAQTGGIISALSARSDEWALGANYGNWQFALSQPLAIKNGRMDLSYISGYDDDGDYALSETNLDLSARNRLSQLSLLYSDNTTYDQTSFAVGVDYLHNAPARNYQGDILMLSAAWRYVF